MYRHGDCESGESKAGRICQTSEHLESWLGSDVSPLVLLGCRDSQNALRVLVQAPRLPLFVSGRGGAGWLLWEEERVNRG